MKYFSGLIILFVLSLSCNLNKDRKLSAVEQAALEKAHNDSVTVVVDSLYRKNIYVPPLYDQDIFDSATTVKFFDLAKATEGDLKLLVNSQLVTTEIVNILRSAGEDNADLLILMDKTGSMSDDIENVKKGLRQIIHTIESFKNIRLGIALYGDKNEDGKDWFSFRNFESNYMAATDFINNIEVTGGGDWPESVYEGFFAACDQGFWKSQNKRMIILIGDAPPLEKPLSRYGLPDIIAKAGENNVKMNFYPIVVTEARQASGADPVTFEKEKIITQIFPNPVSGTINIGFVKAGAYSIDVFNSAGVLILSDKISGNLWRKDISRLSNGAYLVRAARKDKKYETMKFVIYR